MRYLLIILLFLSQLASGQIINASQPYRPLVVAAFDSLLLDSAKYSNAGVAYSLRKVRNGYTGNCIRIRKDTTGQPEQDISFSGGIVDTNAIKSFLNARSGFVTTWYDQSTNGRNATQTTASNQPRIALNGVIERDGGKVTINFGPNGTPWHLLLPTGFLNGTTNAAYFHVAKITDFANSNAGVFGPSTSFLVGLEVLQHSVYIAIRGLWRVNGTAFNSNPGSGFQIWDNATTTLTSIMMPNAIAMEAYKNGTIVSRTSTGVNAGLNFNGVYAIGMYNSTATDAFMNMQELIIFTGDQNNNRNAIHSNINSFYGIY